MDEIIQGLFIGPWTVTNDKVYLEKNNIEKILSIGCDRSEVCLDIEGISYPNIADQPQEVILKILPETDKYISESLRADKKIFVHCVYGQSRSATVIISYMMNILNKTLFESIDTLSRIRPCICINPGFLCQLYLMSTKGCLSADYKLITLPDIFSPTSFKNINQLMITSDTVNDISMMKMIFRCKNSQCKYQLLSTNNIIEEINYKEFLATYVDPFWAEYRSSHGIKCFSPSYYATYGWIPVCPNQWILAAACDIHYKKTLLTNTHNKIISTNVISADPPADVSETSKLKKRTLNSSAQLPKKQKSSIHPDYTPLCCPGCRATVGGYRPWGLSLCHDLVPAHLFFLLRSACTTTDSSNT